MIVPTLGIAAALVGFAMLTSDSKRIALYFCLGLVVVFAVFYGARHVRDLGGAPRAAAAACRSWRWRSAISARPAG